MWSTPRPVGYLKADRDVPNPNVRFWMGRSKEDVLHWYQGQLGRYETMEENQRIFCRMADQLENVVKRSLSEFNRQHEITRQVMWDRQHMREFNKSGRKVRPYVELTREEKARYREILSRNRKAIAMGQKTESLLDRPVRTKFHNDHCSDP
eukprot:gb/GECG01006576.1/.p1 GENE.gb/GECG01006576.1/~~gb/GECG01006576.1/.p1  ORF type:complete len:151 (+),score=8.52 gb/GECG01006576.1/:1-453(+)